MRINYTIKLKLKVMFNCFICYNFKEKERKKRKKGEKKRLLTYFCLYYLLIVNKLIHVN